VVVSVLRSLAAIPILVVYSRLIWVFPAPGGAFTENGSSFFD
jgi:hypothetical protein